MGSPWSSQHDDAPEDARRLLERAHGELLAGNEADERLQQVRPLVRDSWRRSISSLVGVEGAPRIELTADAIDAYRREHPLSAAVDIVRGLLLPGGAEDSGVVVAMGDAAGRMLWVEGDHSVRRQTDDIGLIPGTNWSEDTVGTTAPGTALTLGSAVQIRGAEHFNRFAHPWSCTAVPVMDPESRRILGVIDVTGGSSAVTPQAQLLVTATARAVEAEMLVHRLRARSEQHPPRRSSSRARMSRGTLRVLGRDRALLELGGDGVETVREIGARHAEILLMLSVHRQGLSAGRLSELVYGTPDAVDTLRPEIVRLRRVLEQFAPSLAPLSRPYRLPHPLETDAHQMLSLLDRGAHRAALAAFHGEVLPDSTAPGVEEFRDTVRTALREALMSEASVDVLLTFADTVPDDVEVLRLCLQMLPARSPKRAALVARLERLEQ